MTASSHNGGSSPSTIFKKILQNGSQVGGSKLSLAISEPLIKRFGLINLNIARGEVVCARTLYFCIFDISFCRCRKKTAHTATPSIQLHRSTL